MSTKIYNGYKITKMNLSELDSFCMDLRNKIFEKAKELCIQKIAITSSRFVSSLFLESFDDFPKEIVERSEKYTVLFAARKIYMNILQQEDTFKCSFVFYPFKKDILATFHSAVAEFTDIFEKSEKVKEYGYWNNTDKPENVSDKEWNKRKKDWDTIFNRNKNFYSIPIKNGFLCDIINKDDYYNLFSYFSFSNSNDYDKNLNEYMQKILENVPSFEKRMNEAATDRSLSYYINNVINKNNSIDYKDFIQSYYKAKEWIANTDEGRTYYEDQKKFVASKIPEKITEEHLKMNIPSNRKEDVDGKKGSE